MATSKATTVDQYLAELPEERRATMNEVLAMLRANMPQGYEESMAWGMISYSIPLSRYPGTYNGQPLSYAALAAQKNAFSLYLTGAYLEPATQRRIEEAFRSAGLRLDMGKSCIRFRKSADLPLEQLGRVVASMPPETYIARYEEAREASRRR